MCRGCRAPAQQRLLQFFLTLSLTDPPPRCEGAPAFVLRVKSVVHNADWRYQAWMNSYWWWAAVDSNHVPPR